ncbi:MAG: MFS transporter [Thermoleophilia bacterium]
MRGHRTKQTYYAIVALTTLAQALIWGVNTLFLLDAGLDIFGVMVANAAFAAGMVLFEVPTGVVADTVGRRVSYLLCVAILFVSTLLYVWFGAIHAGLAAFIGASVLLGLGYTFFTGAVEAWLVDALLAEGYTGKMEVVFAHGGIAQGVAMLVGTVLGGFLGQISLALPYVARAAMLVPAGLLGLFLMRDIGFAARPLRLANFGEETQAIARTGVRYGLRDSVVRPLMIGGLVQGMFFMYGFYSWQRYFLDLLGRDLVWVNGLIAALVGVSSIAGAALVGPLRKRAWRRSSVVIAMVAAQALLVVLAALLQVFWIAVPLYLLSTLAFGVQQPVRQAWLNARIPSQQRATLISLDALFADAGGAGGQVGLGWLSRTFSIPLAWVVGGAIQAAALPFVWRARRASHGETDTVVDEAEPLVVQTPDCSHPMAGKAAC